MINFYTNIANVDSLNGIHTEDKQENTDSNRPDFYTDIDLDNMPVSNYSYFKKYQSLIHSLRDNDKKKKPEHQRGQRQVLDKFLSSIPSGPTTGDLSSYDTTTQNSLRNLKSEDDFFEFESEASSNVSVVTIDDDDYESVNLYESPFDNPGDNPSICMENIDQVEDSSTSGSDKVSDQKDGSGDNNKKLEESDDCIILDDEPGQSSFKVRESEYRNHIRVGMKVMALKDKLRNMWHFGTIVRIEGKHKNKFKN